MIPIELEYTVAGATILSGIAVLAGVGTWFWRLRGIRPVVFGWDSEERLSRWRRGKQPEYTFELRNSGSGAAHILEFQIVGAEIIGSDEFRPRKTLGSGESFTLLIRSPDISHVWFRVLWREVASSKSAKMEWRRVHPSAGNGWPQCVPSKPHSWGQWGPFTELARNGKAEGKRKTLHRNKVVAQVRAEWQASEFELSSLAFRRRPEKRNIGSLGAV